MKFLKYMAFITFLLCAFSNTLNAQFFGKNKLQYSEFNWQYIQSEHFDIYFTDGGKGVATFVAQVAEESYQQLRKDFRYDLVDRIKLIVYNSHNDFGQTNVDLSPPEESVGGFTEFFKNRVVIPYEGEWEKFRHVIHHELTHAVMLQMVYGAGAQSIITGLTQLQLPLWFVEGLAEYESRGWDIESDMFMRDATLNDYLPPVDYLYGFMAYKGGQSVWNYIAERYGDEKVGELLGKVKLNKSVERGLDKSIGIDTKELTKRWHLYLKRKYWPDIADRKQPEEIAERITEHLKEHSFVNTSPSMSNKGDKIAFLSDKEDYFDIYIASSIDRKILKKVVRGQRAGNLEELHWLRGRGIGWSPDDKKLVFSAKAGAEDQLHIVDIKKEKIIQSYDLGFDGIYNPTWSPVENKIAFMGIKKGLSDIYIYNIDKDKLFKVTSDMFSDTEPAWSPDGKKLIFSSDRGDYIDTIPENFKPTDINMKNYDIYEINADGTGLKKITGTEFLERSPIYSPDGKYITFSSDRSGVSNIYIKNMETSEEWPITNVLTGAFLPTWGGKANRLAFSSFYYAGYDVYLLKNPLEIEPGSVEVEETHYIKSLREQKEAETQVADESVLPSEGQFAFDKNKKKYRNFIFDEDFKNAELAQKHKQVFLDSADYALPTGEFKVHEYQVKFSPDLVYGSVGYNQFFGTQGYTNILLSDVMGDHRINLALNLFGDFRNADYAATYLYLPKKIDYGVGVYHNAYFFYSNSLGWVRDRNYGISFHMSNPFNRYTRLSYGLALMGISRTYMDRPDDEIDYYIDNGWISPRNRFFVLNNLTYTKDTTIWGYTGPTNGKRYAIGITSSPKLGDKGIQFTTIRADWRSYHRLTRNYIIALRGAGGISLGRNPQKFFVGGLSNWINYKYDGGIRVNNIEEIYFASFEMPLRGAYYYGLEGTRYLLSNIEFRFPLVHHLKMGFPLPLEFYEIGGALFVDVGVAWERDAVFKPFVKSPNNIPQLNVDNGIDGFDAYASIGFGPRVNLGIFLLRLDLAWPTDFYHTEKSPIVLWSLGADF